jgi:hypothetical protein
LEGIDRSEGNAHLWKLRVDLFGDTIQFKHQTFSHRVIGYEQNNWYKNIEIPSKWNNFSYKKGTHGDTEMTHITKIHSLLLEISLAAMQIPR